MASCDLGAIVLLGILLCTVCFTFSFLKLQDEANEILFSLICISNYFLSINQTGLYMVTHASFEQSKHLGGEMAFCSKIGNLVRQGVLKNCVSCGSVPMMHLLNSTRYMSTKLFIGGLSYGTDDQTLKEAFNCFGNVTEARVITDRDTGRSRGFGFVNFDSDESASTAMSSMDGQELHGRNIRVSYANDRPTGGFRGGFGGGYGGRSGGYQGSGGFGGGSAGQDDFGGDSGRGF